jgi:CheY-like chemotaxis protein/HPt (histidine-containing phosphotransfer) domain-containing protein
LLLSSSGDRANAKRMAEAGFAAYLTKPVLPSTLMDALVTTWAERHQQKEAVLITRHGGRSAIPTMASSVSRKPPAAGTCRGRVLVVEDNIVNQQVAGLLLERLGCRVDTAANGKEAVEMVTSIGYDVVFMDCQMPVMDGYEATREIRAREVGSTHLPIIAMTAHAMAGAREACLAAGMNDYVSKPVRREAFQRTLEQWIPAAARRADGDRPPSTELPDTAGIDPEVADAFRELEVEGGHEFTRNLVGNFLTRTRERIAAMESALACEDVAEIQRLAHDVKGSTSILGAISLANICRDLETTAAERSFERAREVLARLEGCFQRLVAWLEQVARSREQPSWLTV